MLKTTALRGKNNKYGSWFPHTRVSTWVLGVASTGNTNRSGSHDTRTQKPNHQCILHQHSDPKEREREVLGKNRHPAARPLISFTKTDKIISEINLRCANKHPVT